MKYISCQTGLSVVTKLCGAPSVYGLFKGNAFPQGAGKPTQIQLISGKDAVNKLMDKFHILICYN